MFYGSSSMVVCFMAVVYGCVFYGSSSMVVCFMAVVAWLCVLWQ